MSLASEDPEVCILMAVYNGAAHLQAQLDSLVAQRHRRWQLLASDDGSGDGSGALLQRFADQGHPLRLRQGPGQGGAANFMALIAASTGASPADPQDEGPWLAFADQDDIWHPDRLTRGVQALARLDPQVPALYCSRTWISDAEARPLRLSEPRPKPPGFRNALVQNIAAGNTLLLNPAASRLVQAAAVEAGPVVVHDWWIYQIVTGAGGQVLHDDRPALYYRQHGGNDIGANDQMRDKLRRLRQLLRGDFKAWNDVNIAALERSAARLSPENRARLAAFAAMRRAPLPHRLWQLAQLRLYRQSRAATLMLWLAALLGRI